MDLHLRITGNQMRLSPSRIPVIQRYSTDHPRSKRYYQPDRCPSSRVIRSKMKTPAQNLMCDFNNPENTFLMSNMNHEEYWPTNLNLKVVTEGKPQMLETGGFSFHQNVQNVLFHHGGKSEKQPSSLEQKRMCFEVNCSKKCLKSPEVKETLQDYMVLPKLTRYDGKYKKQDFQDTLATKVHTLQIEDTQPAISISIDSPPVIKDLNQCSPIITDTQTQPSDCDLLNDLQTPMKHLPNVSCDTSSESLNTLKVPEIDIKNERKRPPLPGSKGTNTH